MNKKTIVFTVTAVAALLILLFTVGRRFAEDRKYTKVYPTQGELTEAVYGLGNVKTYHRYEVKLGVTSTARKVYVREGDYVEKGQPLLLADESTFKSPFDGVVTLVAIYEGEVATPQTVIIRVEDLDDRFIELSLEQDAALRIQKNQIAKVSFESLRGQILNGKVTAIFPRGNEFVTHVDVTNLDKKILPGMSADVSIEIGKIKGTLVPAKALRNGVLQIERDGKIQNLKVDVGLVDGLSAEIKGDNLKSTDLVLTAKE